MVSPLSLTFQKYCLTEQIFELLLSLRYSVMACCESGETPAECLLVAPKD